jgi:hypothetical protein
MGCLNVNIQEMVFNVRILYLQIRDKLCGNHDGLIYPRCEYIHPDNGTTCSRHPKPENSWDGI